MLMVNRVWGQEMRAFAWGEIERWEVYSGDGLEEFAIYLVRVREFVGKVWMVLRFGGAVWGSWGE